MNSSESDADDRVAERHRRLTSRLNALAIGTAIPPAIVAISAWTIGSSLGPHSTGFLAIAVIAILWMLSFPVLALRSVAIAEEVHWTRFALLLNGLSTAVWLLGTGAFLINNCGR